MKIKNKGCILYKFLIIIGLIILLFFICISFNNKLDVYKLDFKYDQINNYLDKYKDYEIEMIRSIDNKIYGTIYDSSKNGDLFITIGEFIYDYDLDSFEFYEHNDYSRVVDFYKYNNKIYKIILEIYDNDSSYYIWKIVTDDAKSNSPIASGIINNIFMYPLIIVDNNNFYVAALIQNLNDNEEFILYHIENDKINKIYSFNNFSNNSDKRTVYDIANMKIINNHFVYTYVNSELNQYLIDYNIKNNREKVLYVNKDDSYSIYSYLYSKNYKYLQLVSRSVENTAKILIMDNDNNEFILKSKILTFERYINGNVISHNSGNLWNLIDIKNQKKYDIRLSKNINFFPKYLNINNKIIALGYDNVIYSSDIIVNSN
ncbi:MAG: hypothetical protein ACLUFU_04005 [Bacilli bacterium]